MFQRIHKNNQEYFQEIQRSLINANMFPKTILVTDRMK